MNHKTVYAIAISEGQAFQIVDNLQNAGFSPNDISALLSDKDSSHQFAYEKHTKAPEGTLAGAGTGGTIGGVLGLLAGIGALAIPGAGPFIAAGPLLGTLSGLAAGATLGGIAGGLIGLGIPEIEAKRYENRIAEGNILISVHATDSDEVKRAKEILHQAGAQDISVASLGEAKPSNDGSREL